MLQITQPSQYRCTQLHNSTKFPSTISTRLHTLMKPPGNDIHDMFIRGKIILWYYTKNDIRELSDAMDTIIFSSVSDLDLGLIFFRKDPDTRWSRWSLINCCALEIKSFSYSLLHKLTNVFLLLFFKPLKVNVKELNLHNKKNRC